MKKTLFISISLVCLTTLIHAQWHVTGGTVNISSGTTFKCAGEIRVVGGTFKNQGKVTCQDLKTEVNGTVRGTGAYTINGSIVNLGTIQDNTNLTLSGNSAATITTSGDALYNLTLKKSGAGVNVSLLDPLRINKKLTFSSANNKIVLGDQNLTFASGATIASATNGNKYIATTGSGKVIKQGLGATAFTFPIGAATTGSWNPLTITNTGTTDDISVRVLPNALSGGDTGSPLTLDAVAASWHIEEGVTGGSNLLISCSWINADELSNFDRTACSVRRWNGSVWDSSPLGSSTGSGTTASPYQRARANITSAGYFAVLDGAFPLPPVAVRSEHEDVWIKLQPNPVREVLYINSNIQRARSLRIYDVGGREIMNVDYPDFREALAINVMSIPKGIYFVHVAEYKLVERFFKIE